MYVWHIFLSEYYIRSYIMNPSVLKCEVGSHLILISSVYPWEIEMVHYNMSELNDSLNSLAISPLRVDEILEEANSNS